jgi:predicted HTH transcriptional regulator
LVLAELDALSRPPYAAERTSGVLSKLKPHVESELEALETLEWLRDLTGEELARRRVFTMLLSTVGHGTGGLRTTNERILEALRLGAATNPELRELTGASASTVRNGLCQLIKDGEVVAEGEGYPRTYRLASSTSERTPGG